MSDDLRKVMLITLDSQQQKKKHNVSKCWYLAIKDCAQEISNIFFCLTHMNPVHLYIKINQCYFSINCSNVQIIYFSLQSRVR